MTAASHVDPLPAVSVAAAPAAGRRPLPPSLRVEDALASYLDENGFDVGGYTAPTFDVEAFGRTYTYANTRDRKWAIPLHDLHHAATGYGTDLVGEAEIGAWELVAGCRTPIVYALNGVAVLMGLFVAPLRTLRAFRDARGGRALYRIDHDYAALLALPLGELRSRLGIPSGGLARAPRRLHDEAERERSDPLPGAPPVASWAVALAAIHGVATLAVVAFELARGRSLEGVPLDGAGVRVLAAATAALGALLVAGAPSARRGSLGGRALLGIGAVGLVVANGIALAAFGAAAPVVAAAIAPMLILLAALRRAPPGAGWDNLREWRH